MYCNKCGKEIPDGHRFCSTCGTQFASQATRGETKVSAMFEPLTQAVRLDPVMAIMSVGSFLLLLGPFLAWWSRPHIPATLGLGMTGGPVVLAAGVLLLAALVLSRTGTPGAWGIVMILLSALALALVFQSMYVINNYDLDLTIREGVYVSMVGALVAGCGGGLEYYKASKK